LKQVPEYLLLTLSQCKPQRNTLLNDELLSLLMPQFLGNHINSIIVLQALWRNNQALMIRAICELCRHDQRIMNLSRVLDITQEVKESLMPIVDCEDYYFAVNLAILAGKRDFLHYDVWLQRRIADVGTPFIRALLKYVREHILKPLAALPAELSQQQPPQPTSTKKGSS
jgi:CCR4-NOT transcription complex subunit 1